MIKFVKANPVLRIAIWFVIITFIFTALLATLQEKTHLDYKLIVLPQLAPAVAFFLVGKLFHRARMPIMLKINRVIIFKSLGVLSLPIAMFSVSFLLAKLNGFELNLNQDLSSLLSLMPAGVLIGAIGEELGWRSFLQAFLEKQLSPFNAAFFVGSIWGLWHMGHYQNGLLFMLGFLAFTISASIILAWILRGTNFSLIIAVIFHFSINLGFIMFYINPLTNGPIMLINGIVWTIPATFIWFFINDKTASKFGA